MKKAPFRKFRHFHLPEVATRIPSVTVLVEQDVEDGRIWFVSWAICQPVDNFSRAVGRRIAEETLDTRGYTFICDEDEDAIEQAIIFLMTSRTLSSDYEVRRFREAMRNLITVEEMDDLSPYYRLLSIAHEKGSRFLSSLETITRLLAR